MITFLSPQKANKARVQHPTLKAVIAQLLETITLKTGESESIFSDRKMKTYQKI